MVLALRWYQRSRVVILQTLDGQLQSDPAYPQVTLLTQAINVYVVRDLCGLILSHLLN